MLLNPSSLIRLRNLDNDNKISIGTSSNGNDRSNDEIILIILSNLSSRNDGNCNRTVCNVRSVGNGNGSDKTNVYENEMITATTLTTTNCINNGMNIIKNKNRKNNNNTTITSSDDNSDINTAQPRLFMASVGTQLSCLVLKMESLIVLATCIIRYKYDTILEALFVFHCSILYRIFTIDGEYQNLQRARILVDDISLYTSSWNRALRLESYISSSKQQQANKRGKMSQILHVM